MTRRLVLVASLLVACNGAGTDKGSTDTNLPDSFDGTYQVSFHGESEACERYDELEVPLPYFQIVTVGDTLEFRDCRSATDCDDFPEFTFTFDDKDEEWVSLETWTFFNGDQGANICSMNAKEWTIEFRSNGDLRVQGQQVEEALESDDFAEDADCVTELEDWKPRFVGNVFNCTRIDGASVGGDTDAE